ncbi:MAG TPA: metallophosphoesterase family protein [Phototrophicaceae bacterium]|nr:metallophosphoesterase family protein [Phototrophicaceae bacterium]
MKVGLISDIHAHCANLRRAVLLLREHGAETILCAGDLVDGETEGNAAVAFIRQQNIPCVQGNHDHALSRPVPTAYLDWFREWREDTLGARQIEDALSEEAFAYLRALPLKRRYEWEGQRVLLTHASPWDQVTYVHANGSRKPFYRIAEEAEADVVILGHTHAPMAVYVKGVWVFNPGAVDGNRFEPYNATCAILDLPTMHYEVYDIETAHPVQYVRTRFN